MTYVISLPNDNPSIKDNLMLLNEKVTINSKKVNTPNPSNTNSLQIITFNTPLSKNLLQLSNQIKNA